jgi:hypothetical protein|tara:strand:+ start:23 stop:229 length:207 start_codon:yes stop_codon:yes gene_type:complete
MTKEKLSKIIKDVNKENTPPDGWKKEDAISAHDMTDKEVAASVDLDVSDFSDDGADIDELRDILDGNT